MKHEPLPPEQEAVLYHWHRDLAARHGHVHTDELVVLGHPQSCECHYRPERDYEQGGREWANQVLWSLWG